MIENKIQRRSDGSGLFIRVMSRNSTKRCSSCGSKSGPTGLHQLQVRHWSCACGARHDRDINAAVNTLMLGQGLASKDQVTGYLKSCKSVKFQKKAYDVPAYENAAMKTEIL